MAPEDWSWLSQQLAHSHEPTFAERMTAVLGRAGPRFGEAVGNPEEWQRWVKNGRNAVAHRDPGMVDVDKEWRTTVRIIETIKWLMTLVLLHDLELPEDVIETGLRQQRGLVSASRSLREEKPEWFPNEVRN